MGGGGFIATIAHFDLYVFVEFLSRTSPFLQAVDLNSLLRFISIEDFAFFLRSFKLFPQFPRHFY